MGLLCSIDQSNPDSWGYFDQSFMQFYKQELCLKNKCQEVTEININVLYTEMQGYHSKFKY